MKPLFALPAIALVAACSMEGGFKSPAEMTREERCFNLELAYAVGQTNGVSASALARLRANIDLICADVPNMPTIAAEAQAEAVATAVEAE